MDTRQYQPLNPTAVALASGATAVALALLTWVPMMGFSAGMMGGYQHGFSFAGMAVGALVGAAIAALAGLLFAAIYNAINASPKP